MYDTCCKCVVRDSRISVTSRRDVGLIWKHTRAYAKVSFIKAVKSRSFFEAVVHQMTIIEREYGTRSFAINRGSDLEENMEGWGHDSVCRHGQMGSCPKNQLEIEK